MQQSILVSFAGYVPSMLVSFPGYVPSMLVSFAGYVQSMLVSFAGYVPSMLVSFAGYVSSSNRQEFWKSLVLITSEDYFAVIRSLRRTEPLPNKHVGFSQSKYK